MYLFARKVGMIMYKHCVTEESVNRQRELEQGLLSLMRTRHFDEISISEFCTLMNLPRKSFYRYFSSKEGALCALVDHTLLDFIGSFQQEHLFSSLDIVEAFFSFWIKHKELLTALKRSNLSSVLIQRSVDMASQELPHFEKLFPTQSKYTREYGTIFLVTGLMAMVLHWHDSGFQGNAREMAGIALQLVTQPMFISARQNDHAPERLSHTE